MPDFDLSITICSWNTKEDLRACLASLERVRDEAEMEVIVLDNNSEDESPDMVEEEFKWVRLMRMSRNLGFTGGQNHMLEHRRGRHALLLNSDTVVHPGAIRTLMEYLESHPKIGVLGPKLLNPDGSLQFSARRFPTPGAALFRNTPLGRLFPKNRYTREYLMQDWGHEEVTKVDWVSGAALLAREELLEKIGFLDPEFFMYSEDVDFCFRSWEADFEVIYLPTAVITHAIGRSTDKAPNRMIGRFHRSMFRFYKKNMLPKVAAPLRPFALAGAATALVARASLFITKNKIDELNRRRMRK
ncbi:glycosyltransferase family 2 protein [Fimbriimonas ginsengisoli]|uniref:Glycosyl transferase family protein n=1 Tax=Fimbriimonas ginsengisoli Gsoil 348 TaxID=661478 RepID=A0A068NUB8_FIMGI|nr:glycosyltransferase family 2 protein [Fimbriimonas ginsengisoli]AIE86957.1 glycosyl transferase family protein [Fimbriimonas ginsengisoli Gsoil 348]